MDADGTNAKRLTAEGLVASDPSWTPDGTKILFSAITDGNDRDVYMVDTAAGPAEDLTKNSPTDDFEPRMTPDGHEILFTSRLNSTHYGIFKMDSAGQDRVMLFGNASSMHPQWSTASSKIVFSSNLEKSFDIYTMNYDGSNMTRLTGGSSNETQPSWSPDGTKIVYTSNKGSKNEQVHLMDSDGKNAQRLTRNQHRDLSPEFQSLSSPAKEKLPILRYNGQIVFTGNGNSTFSELRFMNADGSNITQFDRYVDSVDSLPKWSPSGDKVAFVSTMQGHEEIVVINADGSNRTTLIQSTSPFAGLGWSPNGTQLVFSKGDANHKWIFVMNSDGSAVKRLTITDSMDSDPSWSPDGTKIAFTRHIEGSNEIYTIDPEGTKHRALTNDPGSDHSPVWSPEADQIAFVSDRSGNEEIFVMYADGKTEKNLSNSTGDDNSPTWSPDGNYIVFVSDRLQNGGDIYKMDSDGRNQARLTSDQAVEGQPNFGASKDPAVAGPADKPDEPDGPEGYDYPLDASEIIVNSSRELMNVTAGNPASIAVIVTSSDDVKPYLLKAILQVRSGAGVTQHLDLQNSTILPKGKSDFSFIWTPDSPGSFDIVLFVIEESENPQVLGRATFGKIMVREQLA
jgi:Tol biopolymer transport system component